MTIGEKLDREHERQLRMTQLEQEREDTHRTIVEAHQSLRMLMLNYKRICDELRKRDPDCYLGGETAASDTFDTFDADGSRHGPFVENTIERAYRRGFYQGACSASQAVNAQASPKAMKTWLDAVFNWRHEVDASSYIAPFKRPPVEPRR